MKKINKVKILYEKEADVLSWEISNKPIDYAEEAGNMIVHFSKEGVPVLVEILEASNFFSRARTLMSSGLRSFDRRVVAVR